MALPVNCRDEVKCAQRSLGLPREGCKSKQSGQSSHNMEPAPRLQTFSNCSAFRQGFIIPIPTVLSRLKHMIFPYSIWHLSYINHKGNWRSSLWPPFQKAFLQDNALNTNHSHSKREERQCTDLEGVCIAQRDWLFKKGLSYPSAYKENSTPRHYLSK